LFGIETAVRKAAVINRIWLHPPMALARLGSSETPCDNYHWGPNDTRPDGTGKTKLEADETLVVRPDNTLELHRPETIEFKDALGRFKPVCPFFELHGEWIAHGERQEGCITEDVLKLAGCTVADVRWTVTVANLKPFHYTGKPDDRISASVSVKGDEHGRVALHGRAPRDTPRPLVPHGRDIPLGSVQALKPSPKFPDVRLRFTPPHGLIYGPANFNERIAEIVAAHPDSQWLERGDSPRPFQLPNEQLFLNPESAWAQFLDTGNPFRTNPALAFAFDDRPPVRGFPSLGLVDDVSDGIVHCTLGEMTAMARIVVAPPDYAPDRRPFISLADGLTSRERPMDVHEPDYVKDPDLLALEVADLLERVFETQGLLNLDVLHFRAHDLNRGHARDLGLHPEAFANSMFTVPPALKDRPLPLTELGRQRHRRMLALEVLEDRLRDDPGLIERLIRPPLAPERHHDRRMPAGMQGADGLPLHLTQRQYDLLLVWVRQLRLAEKNPKRPNSPKIAKNRQDT
jgi:hypothetical protein